MKSFAFIFLLILRLISLIFCSPSSCRPPPGQLICGACSLPHPAGRRTSCSETALATAARVVCSKSASAGSSLCSILSLFIRLVECPFGLVVVVVEFLSENRERSAVSRGGSGGETNTQQTLSFILFYSASLPLVYNPASCLCSAKHNEEWPLVVVVVAEWERARTKRGL